MGNIPHPQRVDPETGFLEPSIYSPHAFDADKKAKFLEMFVISPNITGICRQLELTPATIYLHLQNDAKFKEELDRARDAITDRIEARVAEYAERPTHFMDRIAWLRAHRPSRWAPDMKLQVTLSQAAVGTLADRASAVDTTCSPAPAPQIEPPSSE